LITQYHLESIRPKKGRRNRTHSPQASFAILISMQYCEFRLSKIHSSWTKESWYSSGALKERHFGEHVYLQPRKEQGPSFRRRTATPKFATQENRNPDAYCHCQERQANADDVEQFEQFHFKNLRRLARDCHKSKRHYPACSSNPNPHRAPSPHPAILDK